MNTSDLQFTQHEEAIEDIDNNNGGYHGYGNSWWFNSDCPFAFKYLNLDSLYSSKYFNHPEVGHPNSDQSQSLYHYMQDTYKNLTGREFSSIIEFGSGGGEITEQFLRAGLDFITVEGTEAGYDKLLRKGIPVERIVKQNLKFLSTVRVEKFDIAMCTEVIEHIEPFFASKIIDNCIKHSNFVWFSAAAKTGAAHYHHMNEQNIEVWDNLFAHMGFPFHLNLSNMFNRAARLYVEKETARGLQ